MKCFIEHKAYQKFRYFIDNTDGEVSGWGKTRKEGEDIYVEDLVIFKQVITGTSTDLDYDARAKFGSFLKKNNEKSENWNLWWHSHYNFNTFWSSVDEKAIENEIGKIPYLLSIVGNQKGDILTRMDITLQSDCGFGCEYGVEKIEDIETEVLPCEITTEEMNVYESLSKNLEDSEKKLEEYKKEISEKIKELKKEVNAKNDSIEEFLDDVRYDEEVETYCKKEIEDKVSKKTYAADKNYKSYDKNKANVYDDINGYTYEKYQKELDDKYEQLMIDDYKGIYDEEEEEVDHRFDDLTIDEFASNDMFDLILSKLNLSENYNNKNYEK